MPGGQRSDIPLFLSAGDVAQQLFPTHSPYPELINGSGRLDEILTQRRGGKFHQ